MCIAAARNAVDICHCMGDMQTCMEGHIAVNWNSSSRQLKHLCAAITATPASAALACCAHPYSTSALVPMQHMGKLCGLTS